MAVHLLILGERAGLRWVLENERMAFPAHRRTQLAHVRPADELLLYTTRGCFHNPTRDRGRIIGRARVDSTVEILGEPVTIGGRDYAIGCDLSLLQLLPRGEGVVLADFVEQLSVFPRPRAWSALLRRPLLTLPAADAKTLLNALDRADRASTEFDGILASY